MGETRRFECTHPGCNKVFHRRDYLERHAVNHFEVKPYVCRACNRQFSRKDLCENHMNTKFHARRAHKFEESGQASISSVPVEYTSPSQKSSTSYVSDAAPPSVYQNSDLGSYSNFETTFPDHAISVNSGYGSGSGIASSSYSLSRNSFNSRLTESPIPNYLDGVSSSISDNPLDLWGTKQDLKRFSDIGQFDDASSSKRRVLPKDFEESKTGQDRSYPASSFMSENSITLDSISEHGSGSTNSTSMESRAAGTGGPNTSAYKMWLMDNFSVLQTEAENRQLEALREPAPPNSEFDKRYEWFFDSIYTTNNEKYGYDRLYSQCTKALEQRAAAYSIEHLLPDQSQLQFAPLNLERTNLIRKILNAAPKGFFQDKDLDSYLSIAWARANVVSFIVHRPTFNPNTAHPALVAVLVLLGMALSDNDSAKGIAKVVCPDVSLYVYQALDQPDGATRSRYNVAFVGHLPAFCLLLRYEPIILGHDLYHLSLTRSSSCRKSADKFVCSIINSVAQLGMVTNENLMPCIRKPIWASISRESYVFHQGVDRGNQWHERSAYEMCKRTIHFVAHTDSVISLSDVDMSLPAISIFNLDIHMPCPECLWMAQNANEFFHICGSGTVLSSVPYLGYIKSLVRFPRVPENAPNQASRATSDDQIPLSILVLRVVAHGLVNLVNRLFCVSNKGDAVMKAVLTGESVSHGGLLAASAHFADLDIQPRIYRGLDIWFRHFEVSYGKVTETLFEKMDSLGLKVNDDVTLDPPSGGTIPQYALFIILYNYSSLIIVHEDLPIVLEVTANLAKWLYTGDQLISQSDLLEFLYMPLFVQWIQSDEARAMVLTSALFLGAAYAATRQAEVWTWNHLFLSAVVYISVIVMWILDLTRHHSKHGGDMSGYSAGHLKKEKFEFVEDATKYLQGVFMPAFPTKRDDKTKPSGSVISVLMLGACILHERPFTEEITTRLVQLVCVLDTSTSIEEVHGILRDFSALNS